MTNLPGPFLKQSKAHDTKYKNHPPQPPRSSRRRAPAGCHTEHAPQGLYRNRCWPRYQKCLACIKLSVSKRNRTALRDNRRAADAGLPLSGDPRNADRFHAHGLRLTNGGNGHALLRTRSATGESGHRSLSRGRIAPQRIWSIDSATPRPSSRERDDSRRHCGNRPPAAGRPRKRPTDGKSSARDEFEKFTSGIEWGQMTLTPAGFDRASSLRTTRQPNAAVCVRILLCLMLTGGRLTSLLTWTAPGGAFSFLAALIRFITRRF